MTVDFMIIGAQKCATTTLYRLLNAHPSIVGSRPKEPHYFTTVRDWRRELPRYEAMFPDREGALRFEASTSYTFLPLKKLEVWEDLYAYNPRLKLLYVVRNPLDRIVSNYMHNVERGYTEKSLEEAVMRDRIYVDVSRYATQIRPFLRRFGEERVRILFFRDVVGRREGVLAELAAFLDVPRDGFGEDGEGAGFRVHANPSLGGAKPRAKLDNVLTRGLRKVSPTLWRLVTRAGARGFDEKPTLSPPLRRTVLHMLEGEIRELEAITGRDLSEWKEPG